jgi:hypothetical protein
MESLHRISSTLLLAATHTLARFAEFFNNGSETMRPNHCVHQEMLSGLFDQGKMETLFLKGRYLVKM